MQRSATTGQARSRNSSWISRRVKPHDMDLPTPPPNNKMKYSLATSPRWMLLRAQLKLWTTCLEDTCQMNVTLALPVLRFGMNTLNMEG